MLPGAQGRAALGGHELVRAFCTAWLPATAVTMMLSWRACSAYLCLSLGAPGSSSRVTTGFFPSTPRLPLAGRTELAHHPSTRTHHTRPHTTRPIHTSFICIRPPLYVWLAADATDFFPASGRRYQDIMRQVARRYISFLRSLFANDTDIGPRKEIPFCSSAPSSRRSASFAHSASRNAATMK